MRRTLFVAIVAAGLVAAACSEDGMRGALRGSRLTAARSSGLWGRRTDERDNAIRDRE
jgi:hypothetical protein